MGDYWIIGVLLGATAALLSNLGLNFQKMLHQKHEAAGKAVKDAYYKYGRWRLGLGLIILGSVVRTILPSCWFLVCVRDCCCSFSFG